MSVSGPTLSPRTRGGLTSAKALSSGGEQVNQVVWVSSSTHIGRVWGGGAFSSFCTEQLLVLFP